MTAEMAVMNKEAVALAADSAVTLQTSTGPKVIPSAIFEELPLSRKASRALTTLAGLIFAHQAPSHVSLNYTGLVIAGFGEMQMYPHLCSYRLYAVANGIPRIEDEATLETDALSDAVIAPFAQREMVDAFIEGLEPGYAADADAATQTAVTETVEGVVRAATLTKAKQDGLVRELSRALSTCLDELQEKLKEMRVRRNVFPILEVVGALPKDELAAMAESLVNLTSFKRKVSSAAETVGGPIDVAVISKGDGFVWIRRKHYFSAELNPRYFGRIRGDGG